MRSHWLRNVRQVQEIDLRPVHSPSEFEVKTFFKGIGLLFLGFIALIVIVAIANPSKSSTPTPAPAAAAKPAEQQVAAVAPTAAPAKAEQPKPTEQPRPAPAAPAEIGETVVNGNWELTASKVTFADVLGKSSFSEGKPAQGKYVIVTLDAKNLHKETSSLNSSDFFMQSPDGIKFKTSSDGTTQLLFSTDKGPKPLTFAEQIQPGLKQTFRLVFDVNPDVKDYTLVFDKAKYAISLDA
jgi:hypothetical protein